MYCRRERIPSDMEDWTEVMGYICADCGTPARENNLGLGGEWGCVVCGYSTSHKSNPPMEGQSPFFVPK